MKLKLKFLPFFRNEAEIVASWGDACLLKYQRPFLNISGGSWDTSLAVATTNTGDDFSCIQDMKEPKTLLEVP